MNECMDFITIDYLSHRFFFRALKYFRSNVSLLRNLGVSSTKILEESSTLDMETHPHKDFASWTTKI